MQVLFATTDLERNVDEGAHPNNDTVRCFAWLKLNVEIEQFASDLEPKSIIASIDGFTAAGKSLTILRRIWLLPKSRGSGRHYGAIWFRENNAAQGTR